MTVDCLIEDARWQGAGITAIAEKAVAATLAHLSLDGFEVSVMACDDTRIAALNADFRGKLQATNVLSWPSEERGAPIDGQTPLPPAPHDPEIGDIAISYDTCAQEAADAGKSLHDHAMHLIVHGTLHLLGYDHERDADATLMEGIETHILGNLGITDPYRI